MSIVPSVWKWFVRPEKQDFYMRSVESLWITFLAGVVWLVIYIVVVIVDLVTCFCEPPTEWTVILFGLAVLAVVPGLTRAVVLWVYGIVHAWRQRDRFRAVGGAVLLAGVGGTMAALVVTHVRFR